MSSPTIMRELEINRRAIAWANSTGEDGGYMQHQVGRKRLTPVNLLIAEMPERRWHEEQEREYELFRAAGNRHVCEECGERTAREEVACTYGYAGHPGADYTSVRICDRNECGHVDM